MTRYLIPLLLLVLVGCDGTDTSPAGLHGSMVVNNRGQTTTFLGRHELAPWLRANPDLRLIAITGYARSNAGTDGYVVIYETPQAERQ